MCVSTKEGGGPAATEATQFTQAQAGCQEHLNTLMARHDGLVQAVVRRQVLGELPFDEALQAGRIGLWQAILHFDPHRGVAFSTYAWTCIMRHIWRAVKAYARQLAPPFPPPGGGGPPREAPDPIALCEGRVVQQALYELVQRLPARLHYVIVARYGLAGREPAFYRQIGAALRLSYERARQLHEQALVWLRHPAHSQNLRSLLGRHALADYHFAAALAQRWLRRRGGRRDH